MRADVIIGILYALFLIWRIYERIRGRPNDFPDDGTLDRSSEVDDCDDDARLAWVPDSPASGELSMGVRRLRTRMGTLFGSDLIRRMTRKGRPFCC
jgi:hypothetical protein